MFAVVKHILMDTEMHLLMGKAIVESSALLALGGESLSCMSSG